MMTRTQRERSTDITATTPSTMRRHLLLIVPWMEPGGADRFNLDLIEQMHGRGWDTTVVTTRRASDAWLHEYTTRTPDVFALHRFLPLEDHPRFIAELIQSRRTEAVIVSHSELGYRLLPYLRGRFPQVAFLDFLHVVEPSWHEGGFPRFSVEQLAHLDFSIASSEQVRAWIVDRGVPRVRTAVCYTAVNLERYRPDAVARTEERRRLGIVDEQVVILFVGRLCDQKDPRMLIAALDRLFQLTVGAVALIVGDGSARDTVEADVRDRGLAARVRLVESVPPHSVSQLMAAADIVFLPSLYEGISLVLFEAMATGLPVVASDVGGQRELVTPDTGVLVERKRWDHDVELFATALLGLVTDRERRQRVGRAARARVEERFSLESMGDQMELLTEHAVKMRREHPGAAASPEVVHALTATAIEETRLADLAESLWRTQRGSSPGEWLYVLLQRLCAPAYNAGIRLGWRWVPLAGARVRRWLLLRSHRERNVSPEGD